MHTSHSIQISTTVDKSVPLWALLLESHLWKTRLYIWSMKKEEHCWNLLNKYEMLVLLVTKTPFILIVSSSSMSYWWHYCQWYTIKCCGSSVIAVCKSLCNTYVLVINLTMYFRCCVKSDTIYTESVCTATSSMELIQYYCMD